MKTDIATSAVIDYFFSQKYNPVSLQTIFSSVSISQINVYYSILNKINLYLRQDFFVLKFVIFVMNQIC